MKKWRFLWVNLLTVFLLGSSCGGGSKPLKMVFISGSHEYESDISLEKYMHFLEETYSDVQITLLSAGGKVNSRGEYSNLPGLEALDDCDVALIFTRRLTIEGEQLEAVKKYALSGRPLVALRTASHGFQNWLEFDRLVLGGNYGDHYDEETATRVTINPGAGGHPVLTGITDFNSESTLYRTSPVAEDVTVLLTGSIPGHDPEPAAWVRTYKGARICYTSLGAPGDWENPVFVRLVTNALFWCAGREQMINGIP